MTDLQSLRDAAEKLLDVTWYQVLHSNSDHARYLAVCRPQTVLDLIDKVDRDKIAFAGATNRIAELEKRLDAAERLAKEVERRHPGEKNPLIAALAEYREMSK